MPRSQDSTNKELFLGQITYGSDPFASYYLPAEEVRNCLESGCTPLIRLAERPNPGGPRIAVILGEEKHPDRAEKDYALQPDYARAIVEAGGNPFFITYEHIDAQMAAISPDAVFLIGGMFNSPAGWYETPVPEDVDRRGRAYLSLLAYAKAHKLPVLGICAGMQMLAGFFGAKLVKGINNSLPDDKSHKQNGEKIAHKILIAENTLLMSIVGQKEIMTNSSHTEAVAVHAHGQNKIAARAEDGIVEAIEPVDGWHRFLLGVQWHPERLLKYGDTAAKKIFEAFVQSAAHE